ncbi:MAG: hypothetical protein QOI66_1752 [Myxococcales bacterium]|jgi:hypothetical protein|nr:hypothetical protein [Myxococcales bacterium]
MLDQRPSFVCSLLIVGLDCTGAIDDGGGANGSPSSGNPSGGSGNPGGGGAIIPGTVAREPGRVTLRQLNQTEYSDAGYISDVAKAPGGAKLGVRDLLTNVVASDPFRMRRGEPATTGGKQ